MPLAVLFPANIQTGITPILYSLKSKTLNFDPHTLKLYKQNCYICLE